MRLLLAFLLAASLSAQVVTITRLDGSTLTVDAADAGTRANPTAVAPGLVSFAFPGVLVLMNPGPGPWETAPAAPFEFKSLTSDVGFSIAETDPKRGFPTHRFLGGELWPFFRADAIPRPPPVASARLLLSWRYDLTLLDRYPRLAHLADLFGDNGVAKLAPQGQRDLAWLWRYKSYRLGGPPLVGWYENLNGLGVDGFDCFHYEKLAWMALRWMRSGRVEDWDFGLRSAMAQACWGLYHTGTKYPGFFAYEKGYGFVGAGNKPDWGKQWFAPLVVWWILTDRHPLLGLAVDEHLAALRRTPGNWWGGDWGERRPARYLDDLDVAFQLTGDPVYRTRAVVAVANAWAQVDPARKLWINKGSPTTTSPWMSAELLAALIRWERHGVKSPAGAIRAMADQILALGTFTSANGFPGTYYRFDGPEFGRGSPALNGFLLPMIRLTQAAETAKRWEDATYGPMLAASWADIEAGRVAPIDMVGIEYSPMGPLGWGKACAELLGGMLR